DGLRAGGGRVPFSDTLSWGGRELMEEHLASPRFRLIEGPLLDPPALTAAMRGHDLVWHLAANTNIRAGARDTAVDLMQGVVGTCNVLEAMRQNAVTDLLFASSGVVYGDFPVNPLRESAGP